MVNERSVTKRKNILSKAEGLSHLVYTAFALDVPQSVIKGWILFCSNSSGRRTDHLFKKDSCCIQLKMVVFCNIL